MQGYSLTYLDRRNVLHLKRQFDSLTMTQVREFSQIREIKAYKGQKRMPGHFYMTKTDSLVAYESRLEMFVLRQLDFNPTTVSVVSQPFILHVADGENSFKHVPDFLAVSAVEEVTVIDVKPKKFADKTENKRKFGATAAACELAGWSYSVQSEPDRLFIENLRWLAGYRRDLPTVGTYAEQLIEACEKKSLPLQELVSKVGPSALVRPVLFHLLWHRLLEIDMRAQLNNKSLVDFPKEAFRSGV